MVLWYSSHFVQKGFGDEEYPGIQLELEKYFNKYGKTNAVRMRRIDGTKAFKVIRQFYFDY